MIDDLKLSILDWQRPLRQLAELEQRSGAACSVRVSTHGQLVYALRPLNFGNVATCECFMAGHTSQDCTDRTFVKCARNVYMYICMLGTEAYTNYDRNGFPDRQ